MRFGKISLSDSAGPGDRSISGPAEWWDQGSRQKRLFALKLWHCQPKPR